MKLTMWRVVVLNMHTKFRENSLPLYYVGKTKTIFVKLRTTANCHIIIFIDFYFHFLTNFQTKTSPHMFSIFTHVMKHVLDTNSEPGLPLVLHQLVHRRFPNNSKLKNN